MNQELAETLKAASKTEKDPRVLLRITAIHMILVLKKSVKLVAKELMRSKNWAYKWLNRFQDEGLSGLHDRRRTGRPNKLETRTFKKIVNETLDKYIGVQPIKLQHDIRKNTGVKYSVSHVRKTLRKIGLKPKKPRKVHVNKARRRSIRRWQKRLLRQIARLKYEEFTIGIEDEAFVIYDVISGKKYWVPIGQELLVTYTGSHKRVAVHGTIMDNGRHFFRTYEYSTSKTVIAYLREMYRRHGKIAIIMDRASTHRSTDIKLFLKEMKGKIKIIYLPKGCPELNADEEYWHQLKHDLLVAEYYPKFSDMKAALTKYLRTKQVKLDIYKFLYRDPKDVCP